MARSDGTKPVDIAIPVFGYKSHISIDRMHGLIRRQAVTDAARHDCEQLREVLITRLAGSPWHGQPHSSPQAKGASDAEANSPRQCRKVGDALEDRARLRPSEGPHGSEAVLQLIMEADDNGLIGAGRILSRDRGVPQVALVVSGGGATDVRSELAEEDLMLLTIPTPPERETHSVTIAGATETTVGRLLLANGIAGYEPETLAAAAALIDSLCAERFADIGANIGIYAWTMKAIFGGRVSVRAYEPFPPLVELARKIARQNDLDIDFRAEALGAAPGTATLYVSAQSDSSNSLNARFRKAKDEISVAVVTADETLSDFPAQILKIDTESTEPDVLLGAEHFVARYRPWIICEVLAGRTENALQAFADRHSYLPFLLDGSPWCSPAPIAGDPNYRHRDWLLAPARPDAEIVSAYERWLRAFRSGKADPEAPIDAGSAAP